MGGLTVLPLTGGHPARTVDDNLALLVGSHDRSKPASLAARRVRAALRTFRSHGG